jgi:hypothetical protein
MKGGYINIDCTGLDLTKGSTAQTITGIYNKVSEAMKANKPIFTYKCIWGNLGSLTPIQVFALQTASDTITVTASTLQVVIKNDDTITIVNMVETE